MEVVIAEDMPDELFAMCDNEFTVVTNTPVNGEIAIYDSRSEEQILKKVKNMYESLRGTPNL